MSARRQPLPAAPVVSKELPDASEDRLAEPSKDEVTSTSDPVAKKINSLHADICHAGRVTIEKAVQIGQLLTNQKSSLKHGSWLSWIDENLSFTSRTASNYVRIFERRDELKSETLSDLTAAYKLLGILAEPELNSKVRIQFTHERVEIKKVRFPVTYTEVNLGFTQGHPRANPEPEPEPKEAEIVSVTPANEADPPAPIVATPKQPAKPVIDVEAEVAQEHESPVQSDQTPVLDDGQPDAITCYKVDATITLRVTRATDASSKEEAIRLVKRLYGEGLERHLKSYINCDRIEICSMFWEAEV